MSPDRSSANVDRAFAVDVLVLGGGPAGAWAAIEAAESGATVALADKGRVGASGATAAVNTAVIDVAPNSASRGWVIERRLQKGSDLARGDWIERMVDEAHAKLGRLTEWGYVFPTDDQGLRYRGNLRGPDYMQLLRRRLHKLRIKLLDQSPALELLCADGAVVGASGVDRRTGADWIARAGSVIIATGGCAFMSKALGTYGLTGDGLLMAAEAGAVLSGLEFSGQYGVSHVDATVTKNLPYSWATFTDAAGRTLPGDDIFELLAEHLPAGPVYAVIDKAAPNIQEALRRGQPNIFLALDRQGIDPFRQRFPITLRYEGTVRGVGGLTIDPGGATSVPGLYAAGDAASREAVVGSVSGGGGPNATWAIASGAWAGRSAAAQAKRLGPHLHDRSAEALGQAGLSGVGSADIADIADCIKAVQAEMFPLDRSFTRQGDAMLGSVQRLNEAWRIARNMGGQRQNGKALYRSREVAAMAATARWIYASALARPETRGIHRRRDYPTIDPAQSRRLEVRGVDKIAVRPAGRTP
jgi:succinate dehydrogenase/fumarate reductase flavoprotein subunit